MQEADSLSKKWHSAAIYDHRLMDYKNDPYSSSTNRESSGFLGPVVVRAALTIPMPSVLPHSDLAAIILEGDLVHEFADQVYPAPVAGIEVVGVLRV